MLENSRGKTRFTGKTPIIYDICLTWWEYLTYYYLAKHEAIGHKGAKGCMLKTEDDFLHLARAWNRVNDSTNEVMLVKEYAKPLREDGKTFKRRHRKPRSSPPKSIKDMSVEELNNLKVTNIKKFESSKINEEDFQLQIKPQTDPFILPKNLPMTYNTPFVITNPFNLPSKKPASKPISLSQALSQLQSLQADFTTFKSSITQKLDTIIAYFSTQTPLLPPPKPTLPSLNSLAEDLFGYAEGEVKQEGFEGVVGGRESRQVFNG